MERLGSGLMCIQKGERGELCGEKWGRVVDSRIALLGVGVD